MTTGDQRPGRPGGRQRLISILILGALVVVLLGVAFRQGGVDLAGRGVREGLELFASLLPQLLIGFTLAGLVTVLVPADLVASLIGEGSGVRGLLVATVAGAITPGGPFLQFPLVAALANSGAGTGPMAAYVTAWSLLGLNRVLVWELPVLGAPWVISRLAVSIPVAFLVGLAVPPLLRLVERPS
jgi:uncharacterized membrane protein YraQ (UPF0718 family)